MQFLIIAHDGTDDEALERRMAAREDHIALSEEAVKRGEQLFGVAILDENDKMCGSVMVVDFPTKEDLQKWLEQEPYVTGGVWQSIDIKPCKVGPGFEK